MYVCTYVFMYVCTYVCMCVHMYACMYVCAYVCVSLSLRVYQGAKDLDVKLILVTNSAQRHLARAINLLTQYLHLSPEALCTGIRH